MKRTNLFKIMSLGAAALLVACSGSEKPVSPKEANLQSASDSASYYLGFMAAGNILQQKQMGDTLLESPERVDAYWDGYQRGIARGPCLQRRPACRRQVRRRHPGSGTDHARVQVQQAALRAGI